MGIKERRRREKQELRQNILDAAREVALHEGWQAVTIRRIADHIEYSPPTIYEYFASKDDILIELMRHGFNLLLKELETARESHGNPANQLKATTRAYWRFAWTYPELYQVVHGLGGVSFHHDHDKLPEGRATFQVLLDILQELMKVEHLDIADPVAEIQIMWATMHGLISLTMNKRIGDGPQTTEPLVDMIAENFLTVLRAGNHQHS